MTVTDLLRMDARLDRTAPVDVEIVIPVFNEERALGPSVRKLQQYLSVGFPFRWLITIADNASVDRTWGEACALAAALEGVQAVHLPEKGRGRALRAAWAESTARVVAYMDVDLSTDLDALLPLVAPLISGHSDVAIGTRLAPGSRVVRGPRREVISRGYNFLLRAVLGNHFSDAQCGFKAVRTGVARSLLPLVEDHGWFFDTELLVLAEHNGLRIHEVPVDWVDDPDSRVRVASTARDDLRGLVRLLRRFSAGEGALPVVPGGPARVDRSSVAGQVVRFAAIGTVSTAIFAGLFLALARPLGVWGADLTALLVSAAANLEANRRLTFGVRGRSGRLRHHTAGLALAGLPLAMNLAALALAGPGRLVQLGALTAANLLAAAVRFAVLRRWVFETHP